MFLQKLLPLLALTDIVQLNHTTMAVSTETPPTCCSDLLFVRDSQSEQRWLKGSGAKHLVLDYRLY